jgi:hypothetical protein
MTRGNEMMNSVNESGSVKREISDALPGFHAKLAFRPVGLISPPISLSPL